MKRGIGGVSVRGAGVKEAEMGKEKESIIRGGTQGHKC